MNPIYFVDLISDSLVGVCFQGDNQYLVEKARAKAKAELAAAGKAFMLTDMDFFSYTVLISNKKKGA